MRTRTKWLSKLLMSVSITVAACTCGVFLPCGHSLVTKGGGATHALDAPPGDLRVTFGQGRWPPVNSRMRAMASRISRRRSGHSRGTDRFLPDPIPKPLLQAAGRDEVHAASQDPGENGVAFHCGPTCRLPYLGALVVGGAIRG